MEMCHLQTLQLFPRRQENNGLPATYKPYCCSHAAEKQRCSCHLQILQLFPRCRKTMTFLPLTNPTIVPTLQGNNDFRNTKNPTVVLTLQQKLHFACHLQTDRCPRAPGKQRFACLHNLKDLAPLAKPVEFSCKFEKRGTTCKPCSVQL